MRKFIYLVCLFFLVIVIFDRVFGFVMESISNRVEIGVTGRDNFICNKVTDDMLVFGSSRAVEHYNAQMISDSLGIPCYNCGETGCGIILAYGRLLMILDRYTPKTIIYEVTPEFDFLDGQDNHQFLFSLKRHYNRPGIDSIFWNVDPKEKYKMLSKMYQHNSSFLQNVVACFTGISGETGIKGFRPYDVEMDTMKVRKGHIAYETSKDRVYDSLKIQYLHKFLDKTKGMNVFFVVSPMWYEQDTSVMAPIKEICQERGPQLIDFANSPKYVHNNKYFKDGEHLNARGADEFTRDLIQELRKRNIGGKPCTGQAPATSVSAR